MRTILWAFEGTLASRPGRWAGAMLEVLDAEQQGHGVTSAELIPHLHEGFPWLTPDRPHPELSDPRAWWKRLQATFERAYVASGCPESLARRCAPYVRERYLRPQAWRVYPDVTPVLARLSEIGWRHLIVANAVPELPALVGSLGLGGHIAATVTSARVGVEKPHPDLFTYALDLAGRPADVWMVGDDPETDIRGAATLGIPGILVRRDGGARRRAKDLWGVATYLSGEVARGARTT